MNHRDIWRLHFGEIPKDNTGLTYEIHHKDGNRQNNSIDNLVCVSIKEHYNIHWKQGDFGACASISKRMKMTEQDHEKLSCAISEANKKKVGNKNPFYGKHHTKEARQRHSEKMRGVNHPFFGIKRPNHSKMMKAKGFGKTRSPEHKQNLKKVLQERAQTTPIRACTWAVRIDKVEITVKNLKKFCRENEINYTTFLSSKKIKQFELIKKING